MIYFIPDTHTNAGLGHLFRCYKYAKFFKNQKKIFLIKKSFNRKYLNRTYEINIDEEQIMDSENRFEEIIIKVSHPTEKNLGIYDEQTGNSFAIDFWDCVAETWNKVYASIMIMKRISCSESGICNLDESVQFRPTGGNYIKFRNGKLSFRDLRRMKNCILKSIKKLKNMKNLKVELKAQLHKQQEKVE